MPDGVRGALFAAVLLVPPPGATNCSGCHGSSLAGRDAGEMAGLLNGYRSGTLPSTVMGRLVKGLSAVEIDAVAAWVAGAR